MAEPFQPASRAPTYSGSKARDKALALWRGVDLRAEERALRDTAAPISRILDGVLDHIGLEQKRANVEILRVWNHLLDSDVVAHAQPTALRKGTLFVTVDSSVWLDEIVRYRSRDILRRLQTSFGKDLIAKISYRQG